MHTPSPASTDARCVSLGHLEPLSFLWPQLCPEKDSLCPQGEGNVREHSG